MMVWGSWCNFRPTAFAQSEAALALKGCLLNQLCNRRHLKRHLYCLLGTNEKKNKTSGTKIKLNCTLCKITDSCTSRVEFSTERTASVNTAVSTSTSLRLLTLNGRAIGFLYFVALGRCAYKTLLFSSLSQDDIWDVLCWVHSLGDITLPLSKNKLVNVWCN